MASLNVEYVSNHNVCDLTHGSLFQIIIVCMLQIKGVEMIDVLIFLIIGCWFVLAFLLVSRYRRTGEKSCLWLLVALVVWPILRSVLMVFERQYVASLSDGEFVALFPFSLVSRGVLSLGELIGILQYLYQLIFEILIIIAVLKLGGQKQADRDTAEWGYPLGKNRHTR